MILPYLQLALSFVRVSLSAYGGGIAAISLIRHEVVVIRGWLSVEEFIRVVTLAEMTPGPLIVNTATFIGFRLAGVPGSLVATAAVLSPALLLLASLLLAARRLTSHRKLQVPIQDAVKPAVLALMLMAIISFGRHAVTDLNTAVIAALALLVLLLSRRKIHPVLVVIAGGIAGLFLL